jgi:hypothetical protein
VLERNEWRVTNLFFPGFWKHTFIYTGSLEEMDEYFKNNNILNSSVSEYLKNNKPDVYRSYSSKINGYKPNMIEAKHQKVRIGPIEDYGQSEYLAVLRPKISDDAKLKAIIKAVSFLGKPYDYEFNYQDNSTLACSEIIYHSYIATGEKKELDIGLVKILWIEALLPNDIAKCFSINNHFNNDNNTNYDTENNNNNNNNNINTDCSMEFIAFIDSDAGFDNMNNKSSFTNSWNRTSITIIDVSGIE